MLKQAQMPQYHCHNLYQQNCHKLSLNQYHLASTTQLLIANHTQKAQLLQTLLHILNLQVQAVATASETATQEDEKQSWIKTFQKQNCLVNIAKDYQAKLTDTAAKTEIQTAITTVQEEVTKSTTLLAASATNAALCRST